MPETLRELVDILTWPTWGQPGPPRPPMQGRLPQLIRDALARADLVRDGGAYVEIFADEALAMAEFLERDPRPLPLAGLPVAIKDLQAVAGYPLRAGSAIREGASPESLDATIVARLRGLGAVPIGLVALHEFAFGVTGLNDYTGFPRNPVDSARIPGGSSSGSAVAVAEGSAIVALGTDTGGSIRIPAALCGVVGFKPSRGTYPLDGVFPLAPSLDHVGLLGASVDVIRAVHTALCHSFERVEGPWQIGVIEEELETAQPVVADRVRDAIRTLERNGARVRPISWPKAERHFATSTAIMFPEAAAIHRQDIATQPERYTDEVRHRLEVGLSIEAATYVIAKREQERLRWEVARILDRVDFVLGPTVPMVAPRVEEARHPEVSKQLVRNTRLANVVGVPALSLPVPGDGLPVGLQITARSDEALLGIASEMTEILAST